MTPSAARLLGLIRSRTSSGAYWTRLILTDLAAFMGLTVRTLARAKAELDSMGLVKFRTISNGEGRGHKLHAAIAERLEGKRGELLHGSKCGRERHSWTRIGGSRIERPSPRPHDIAITKGKLRFHHDLKPTPPKADLAKRGPTKRQVAFAHWLKRDLWAQSWWDNCKVERSDGHLFGFALRSIAAGYDLERIYRSFDAALREMHGTATDVGLIKGNPTAVRFSLSSTVAKAAQLLGKTEFVWAYKKRPVTDGIGVEKPQRSGEFVTPYKKEPVRPSVAPETQGRKEPRRPRINQSARLLAIIDAL